MRWSTCRLPEADLRHQLVVSLLAILELAKLQVIRVLQDPQTEVFFIARREGASLQRRSCGRRSPPTRA